MATVFKEHLEQQITEMRKKLAMSGSDGPITHAELALVVEDLKKYRAAKSEFNRRVKTMNLDPDTRDKLREFRRVLKNTITRVERFFIRSVNKLEKSE
jgi:hypothetical protein